QKVPATVLSRCLQFNLRPMAPETVLEHLVQVLGTENVPAEPQALRLLARAARGSMRDALSLTDQAIAFGSGRLDEASVRVMLGSVDRSYVFRLLDALARGDGRTVVKTSEVLRLNGLSAASTLEEMATVLQRMAVLQAVPDMGAGDDDSDPEIAETARLAQAMPADETQLLYSLCLHGRGELGLAPDEYAALTMVLLRLLAFKPSESAMPASPVQARQAAAPGSAAEPGKKPPPELPAAHRTQQAHVSAAVAPAPSVQAAAIKLVPAPAFNQNHEKNQPSTQVARVQHAINSEATAELPASPGISSQDASLGGAWSQIVNQLVAAEAIGALTRELALQSELCSREAGIWALRVERESLSQPAARDKLQLALQTALADTTLKLTVEVGPVTDTPARRNSAASAERQRAAEALIQNDPFVQDMIRDWGARIVPGSIKSVSP
ncbi:MAG: DNA polymerase III subunit gamma/tau C-terminal domain-containing protein, partial [Polaromonas sp.]